MKKGEPNREFVIGERVVVNEKAPGGYIGKFGTVREVVVTSRYGVSFDSGKKPIVYLDSECLDPVPKVPSGAPAISGSHER